MKILGVVNEGVSSACLIKDKELVAAASEERFTRVKNDVSWPAQSIDYVLKSQGLTLDDIDYIGYGWHAGFNAQKHLLMFFDRLTQEAINNPEGLPVFRRRTEVELQRDDMVRKVFMEFIATHNLDSKVMFFDHHECHAFSAFLCSPFEKALVLTCDGRGDFQSSTVSIFDRDKHEVIYRAHTVDSLGVFYARITHLLGYKVNRHEGKITGLAAYGDPLKYLGLMEKMISYKDGQVTSHIGPYFSPFAIDPVFSNELLGIIRQARPADVAAAAQRHLENVASSLVEYYLKKTGLNYVCMAGGVFANVRLNQKIMELPQVKNIFIQPFMSDGGLAIGAAAGVSYVLEKSRVKWSSMCLGPEYSQEEIAACVNDPELTVEKPEDIVSACIEAISSDLVVGWFQGRMEEGPRALCHRSILYHCRDKSVNDWLNKRLMRTEFMPFAPVTAIELGPRCYKNWRPDHAASYYMTVTYDCTGEMLKDCPAAVHIDGTARPQIVSREMNPLIHEVLMKWYEETKGLSIINTSFNMHEEPIVCSPYDAVQGLKNNMVDVLIIGPFVVQRKSAAKKIFCRQEAMK